MTSSMVNKLQNIDNGRYNKLLKIISIENECFDCSHFNKKVSQEQKCFISPSCIGATLSESLKLKFLWKLDILNNDEYIELLENGN